MSHMNQGSAEIKDIDALEAAAKIFGGTLVRNQSTYRWYGHYMQDTPLPEGVKESDLGKCSHVITMPGAGYDIGIVQQKNGNYKLMFDYWGPGQKLVEVFGQGLGKLQQQYARQATLRSAKRAGYTVREKTLTDGSIRMQLVHA